MSLSSSFTHRILQKCSDDQDEIPFIKWNLAYFAWHFCGRSINRLSSFVKPPTSLLITTPFFSILVSGTRLQLDHVNGRLKLENIRGMSQKTTDLAVRMYSGAYEQSLALVRATCFLCGMKPTTIKSIEVGKMMSFWAYFVRYYHARTRFVGIQRRFLMRSLIVVRCGDQSLHLNWCVPRQDRTYDVAVSYFGNYPDRWIETCDIFHTFKGSKWEGLADFLRLYDGIWHDYDYIWFPDDDLCMCRDDLERFFEICRDEHFVIAHPSLLPSSFFSWSITLQRRWCCWRSTNFVEIMAPCFRGEDFVFFQSSFSENTSGWGLDYLWWWLAKQHGLGKFAVVDEIGMLHTRAVGTAMSGGAKSNPRVEEDALYEKFNFRKEKPRTLSYNTQPLKILANKIFNHRNYCTKRFY